MATAHCATLTGRIRSKTCGRAAVAKCGNCEQPVCITHAVREKAVRKAGGFVCPECVRAWKEAGEPPKQSRSAGKHIAIAACGLAVAMALHGGPTDETYRLLFLGAIFVTAFIGLKIAKHAPFVGLIGGAALLGTAIYYAVAFWHAISPLGWIGWLIYSLIALFCLWGAQVGLLMLLVAFRIFRGESADDVEDRLIGNFKGELGRSVGLKQ